MNHAMDPANNWSQTLRQLQQLAPEAPATPCATPPPPPATSQCTGAGWDLLAPPVANIQTLWSVPDPASTAASQALILLTSYSQLILTAHHTPMYVPTHYTRTSVCPVTVTMDTWMSHPQSHPSCCTQTPNTPMYGVQRAPHTEKTQRWSLMTRQDRRH